MNKKSTQKKERRLIIKKKVNYIMCLLTCVIIFIGILGAFIITFVCCHIDNSFSLRSDITNYHDLYYETKDLKTLQELENNLQLNQIQYKIKNDKLSTELFDFDVTDTNNIEQLINSFMAKSFDEIDARSENTKVEVNFKDGKMIENVSYDSIEKENLKYYKDVHSFLKNSILMIIFVAIVLFLAVLSFGTWN